MYARGGTVGTGAVLGTGLARTGFPLLGLILLALTLVLAGLLLIRAGVVRKRS